MKPIATAVLALMLASTGLAQSTDDADYTGKDPLVLLQSGKQSVIIDSVGEGAFGDTPAFSAEVHIVAADGTNISGFTVACVKSFNGCKQLAQLPQSIEFVKDCGLDCTPYATGSAVRGTVKFSWSFQDPQNGKWYDVTRTYFLIHFTK